MTKPQTGRAKINTSVCLKLRSILASDVRFRRIQKVPEDRAFTRMGRYSEKRKNRKRYFAPVNLSSLKELQHKDHTELKISCLARAANGVGDVRLRQRSLAVPLRESDSQSAALANADPSTQP